ncbi:phosphomannomutase [Ectothiorhodospiraceae bacterium BW-2]|nr:phosphomannomutase [Ectothiorhodospiraceae bacterium BW-2]
MSPPTPTTLSDLSQRAKLHFGTSGARGLVSDMTPEICYAFTQAFLHTVASEADSLIIGHDLRPSSPAITAACIAAIEASGKKSCYCGALPTPALAYYGLRQQQPVIVITGSHIPFDRNGIKFYRQQGEITKADERAMLAAKITLPEQLTPPPLPPLQPDATTHYLNRYLDCFSDRPLLGKRIALYEHSSVARELFTQLLQQLGAEVISLGRTDTFVPIDTEAVSTEDRQRAKAWAAEHHFDAIISTDGDGDRPLIGDEQGEWLRGDIVGILCAIELGATAVATPISSNTALELCGQFTQIRRTRIGSPYVIEAMEALQQQSTAEDVIVGYEANGGFLLATDARLQGRLLSPLPTRDAILPAIALLITASRQKLSLSALPTQLPPRYTASDRLTNIPTSASQRLLQQLQTAPNPLQQLLPDHLATLIEQDSTDGLRLTDSHQEIIHLRPSGNAPELRCYVESSTPERAEALCQRVLQQVAVSIP